STIVEVQTTDLAAGMYYPVVVLNAGGAIGELVTTNNQGLGDEAFGKGHDFLAENIQAPQFATPGEPVTINFLLRSNFAPYTGEFVFQVFASEDGELDASDLNLGRFSAAFDASQVFSGRATVSFPENVEARSRRILIMV